MQTDNLDSFEKLIFSTPDVRKLLLVNITLSLFYGIATFIAIERFTSVELTFGSGISLVLFVYLIPALVSAEALNTFLSNFKRNWALLLSVVNQSILLLFSLIIAAADSVASAWSILWLGLITVYLFTFFILILAVSTEYLKRIAFVSAVQPISVLTAFHIFLGRRLLIPIETYLLNFLLLLVGGVLFLMVVFMVEYLIGSNVSNISAFKLTSVLLQNKKEGLDLGYPAEPDVQTLEIDNGESFRFAAPWVHPGPIAGFGGGDLTQDFIQRLNEDGKGFFLHVPSTHLADLIQPEDKDKVYNALETPEKTSKASKIVERDIGVGKLYGRSFGEQNIIYIDIYHYDDFDMAIFRESVDLEKTMIVDLHREDNEERKIMYYSTSMADKLEEEIKEFEEELQDLEQYEYSAGKAVSINGRNIFTLVEEVEGQKVLTAGFDNNGIPEEVLEMEDEIRESYDKVLLLSTDTHSSLREMAELEKFSTENLINCIDDAETDLKEGSIGFVSRKSEKVSLLREDYQGLIFSINILIRLLPIALILMYIGLVIWVL